MNSYSHKLLFLLGVQFGLGILLTSFYESINSILLPYAFLLSPIVIYLIFQDEINNHSYLLHNYNINMLLLFWVFMIFFRIAYFINNDLSYPYNPSLIEYYQWYFAWIILAFIIQNSFVNTRWLIILLITELSITILTFQRFYFVLFVILSFIIIHKIRIKLYSIYGIFAFFILATLTIYFRTYYSNEKLELSRSEFGHVVSSSLKRPTFAYQTDIRIQQSKKTVNLLDDIYEAIKPRLLFPNKKAFKPGIQIKEQFWPEINSAQTSIPIGFVGTHYLLFGKYFWLTLFLHGLVITILIHISLKQKNDYGVSLGLVFVYTQFIINEHSLFYLTSWLRMLPLFIFMYFVLAYLSNSKRRIHLLISKSNEYGGIQRVNDSLLDYLSNSNYTYSVHIYNGGSKLEKILFVLKVIFSVKSNDVILSTHIQLTKILKFIVFKIHCFVLLHGIEITHKTKRLLNNVDVVFSNSNQTFSKMNRHEIKSFINPYPFLWVGLEPSIKKENLILTVGRLSDIDTYKQFDKLLNSWKIVSEKSPQSKLIIVGEGSLKSNLMSLSTQLGLNDSVTFTGFISDDKLKILYRKAIGFVLPSTQEGQGLVYFEAMSAATPVIGIADTVLVEFITNEKEGLLCKNSVQCLSDSILSLLNNPENAYQMGRNAYNTVSSIHENNSFFKTLTEELNYVWNSRSN